jgi:hypothetical protein
MSPVPHHLVPENNFSVQNKIIAHWNFYEKFNCVTKSNEIVSSPGTMPLKMAMGLLRVFESRFLGTLRALRLICFASGRFSKFGVSKLWQLVINPIISEKLI